jgi:hypothetical protein
MQPASQPPPAPDPTIKYAGTPTFTAILNETNTNLDQLQRRQKLLKEIDDLFSRKYGAKNRTMTYLLRFGHPRAMMNSGDIAAFEGTLKSITGADQINLLLQSPGGDATIVEKMIDMCRAHLSGSHPRFRVIVPNIAKSAATVMALGADSIVMGYCSELGPIDPQVQISVSGLIQWVSALAFVESRDKLMEQIADAVNNNRPVQGLLQQLAGLNIPFTNEMENHIAFAKKTAATLLDKYMFQAKFPRARQRKKKADEIAEKLLSKQLFPVHGQSISGASAKHDLELEVELLERTDQLWELIWDYYIRSELQMNIQLTPGLLKTKFFESSFESLVVQDTAN